MCFQTAAGNFTTSCFVFLTDVHLPEFSYTRQVKKVKCYLFDAPAVEYDIIFGWSFLNQVQIDVLSSQLKCTWFGDEIAFHLPTYFRHNNAVRSILEVPPYSVKTQAESHVVATKSSFADINDICVQQEHLTEQQRKELASVLCKHTKLFNGTVGCYPKHDFHISLKPDAVPYHCDHTYSMPTSIRQVFKDELEKQVQASILAPVYESEWGMPVMVIPKKDGAIRIVDDFRELNKWVVRKCYPLPRIQDIFH